LKADIENDLGDRVDYEKNIKTETRELTKIRNHSIELKRRFEEAKSAIEQFQPELERYLTQNVPSMP
jgi:predicted RNase H-like nuclease (RuvC/YqgF family)